MDKNHPATLSAITLAARLWLQRHVAAGALVWTGIAFLAWFYSSKGIHDALVWGAFAAALPRARRAWPVWNNATGKAFMVLLLFTTATLPFSISFDDSLRDMIRMARLPAGAFAISVWFNRDDRIFDALWYSALAITLVLTADLARLSWVLRGDILEAAHAHEPFMLNHSNVSSTLAGLCLFVFAFTPALRRERYFSVTAAIGILICAAYIFVLASRGPQIAFLCSAPIAGLILIKGRRGRACWFMAATLAFWLLYTNMERINPRFAEREEVATFAGRSMVWEHTWELAQKRPWQGYGFGKRVFQHVYQSNDPPPSPFEYPHPHSYFLFALFQHGRPGLLLYAIAWIFMGLRLTRVIWRYRNDDARLLPGLTASMLLLLHLYGLADYPDNRLAMALVWLVPAALIATGKETVNKSGTSRRGKG